MFLLKNNLEECWGRLRRHQPNPWKARGAGHDPGAPTTAPEAPTRGSLLPAPPHFPLLLVLQVQRLRLSTVNRHCRCPSRDLPIPGTCPTQAWEIYLIKAHTCCRRELGAQPLRGPVDRNSILHLSDWINVQRGCRVLVSSREAGHSPGKGKEVGRGERRSAREWPLSGLDECKISAPA